MIATHLPESMNQVSLEQPAINKFTMTSTSPNDHTLCLQINLIHPQVFSLYLDMVSDSSRSMTMILM